METTAENCANGTRQRASEQCKVGRGLTTRCPGKENVCVFHLKFADIKNIYNLQLIIKYTIVFIVNSIEPMNSHRTLSFDFCGTLVPITNLWLPLTNKCSSNRNVS